MKVLIVDDSVVFRSQIAAALTGTPQIEVVGSAPNGSIALQKLDQLSVDLVTLDMEMPDMDGIAVLKAIRERKHKVRVIIFSAQTIRGAEKALQALKAGADDVISKPSSSEEATDYKSPQERIREILVPKIHQFLEKREKTSLTPERREEKLELFPKTPPLGAFEKLPLTGFQPSAVVIASSTGGPTALETIFTQIPQSLEIPIIIAQHMPPVFTQILAKRLGDLSKKPCNEAKHGDILKPGHIYVAPGDYHLQVAHSSGEVVLELNQGPQRNSVRPAADYLFESAAAVFRNRLLGIVLTGMGQDGLQGSIAIKQAGGRILIQDEPSCVVFGMPGAVFKANCYDGMGDLQMISGVLQKLSENLH